MEFSQIIVLLLPMFVLMGLGMSIFLAMGMSCALTVVVFGLPNMILAQSFVRGLASYDFLALPFYFLAGDLMNKGGITNRLINFSRSVIGHIKGGMSHVNIVASMIFSGVSGSAVADTSAIGSVLIPAMRKDGYPDSYSAAVTGASSTIGPIIPPSIPLVIYGLLAQESIGRLFLAGAVPGVLMGVYLLAASFIISSHRGYPAHERAKFREVLRSSGDALLALLMPFIIIGGITTGIVTPTEAGVIAVIYGLILGGFVYREIKIKELPHLLGQSMVNTSKILIIIATTGLFAWIVANMGIGEILADFFLSVSSNKWVLLVILNLFFLIWGCFLDPITAMVILVPIFIPLVSQAGIDLIHFGLLVVMNQMIGLITPPVGIILYLTSSIANTKVERVIREMVPFYFALILVLILCTFVPSVVLWLPNLLMN